MHGLSILEDLNDRYVEDYRQRMRDRKPSPAELLADKLMSFGPPNIQSLIGVLSEHEDFCRFKDLATTFTPDYLEEILRQKTPEAQMACFATHFEDNWFPIGGMFAGWQEYQDLLGRIPCFPRGMGYEDYDTIATDGREGWLLIAYLLQSNRSETDERVGFFDALDDVISHELRARVPKYGIPRQTAHKLFDGTKYEGIATAADYIEQDTGNFFMDTDDESFYSNEGPEWTIEEVEAAKKEWLAADAIDAKMDKMIEWLEEDAEAHFKELLDFTEERGKAIAGDENNAKAKDKESAGGTPAATMVAAGGASGTAG